MTTHVTMTIADDASDRAQVARVVSFNTEMSVKETLQALSVIATILKHYQPKTKPETK